MLVLKRKRGERIFIITPSGEEIIVALTRCDSTHAAIGIEAAKDVKIRREELDRSTSQSRD